MRVAVILVGDVERLRPERGRRFEAELADGSTPADLCQAIGVDRSEVWRFSVNGEIHDFAYPLKDGDEVMVIPPIAGG